MGCGLQGNRIARIKIFILPVLAPEHLSGTFSGSYSRREKGQPGDPRVFLTGPAADFADFVLVSVLVLVLKLHLALLRAYLPLHSSLLMGLGVPIGCWGLNVGQLFARQAPSLLCYYPAPSSFLSLCYVCVFCVCVRVCPSTLPLFQAVATEEDKWEDSW